MSPSLLLLFTMKLINLETKLSKWDLVWNLIHLILCVWATKWSFYWSLFCLCVCYNYNFISSTSVVFTPRMAVCACACSHLNISGTCFYHVSFVLDVYEVKASALFIFLCFQVLLCWLICGFLWRKKLPKIWYSSSISALYNLFLLVNLIFKEESMQ